MVFSVIWRLVSPRYIFGDLCFPLTVFWRFAPEEAEAQGSKEPGRDPGSPAGWAWVAVVPQERKRAPSRPAGPVDQTQAALFMGDKHLALTCGHSGLREGSPVPRDSAAADGQTSPSRSLLCVFKIIPCHAPRMSELLGELTRLHIFQLMRGDSERQGP